MPATAAMKVVVLHEAYEVQIWETADGFREAEYARYGVCLQQPSARRVGVGGDVGGDERWRRG